MGQPEGQADHNALVDAVLTAAQKTVTVEKDGEFVTEQILDENSLWTKLLNVASNTLGQTIFEINEWKRRGTDATRNMCSERAEDLLVDIDGVFESCRRALDAKAAETISVNKQNSQTSLIGMIGKNKQERVYTVNEKMKGSLFDSIMGRDQEKDSE